MNKDDVLKQLAHEWAVTDIRDDELTTSDIKDALYKAGSRASKEFVSRRMKRLVDEGLVQRREVRLAEGGGRRFAYSPVEGKTWEDVLQYIKVN